MSDNKNKELGDPRSPGLITVRERKKKESKNRKANNDQVKLRYFLNKPKKILTLPKPIAKVLTVVTDKPTEEGDAS